MLVLTRRVSENLIITLPTGEALKKLAGAQIIISTLGIQGNQVRYGLDAPMAITIHREEIQQRIDAGVSQDDRGNR